MIKGTQNPIVGREEIYQFSDGLDVFNTTNAKYVWNIWKKKQGKWINITKKPPKMGLKVPFNFGEKVIGEEFKLEVFKATQKFFSEDYEAKSVGEIIVVPTSGKVPKITKVVLFNRGAKDPNKASYADTLVAQAHCVDMFQKEIQFQLWEDDAQGGGHNTVVNKNNQFPQSFNARVNKNGIAEAKIPLSSNSVVLRNIANKFMIAGDSSEGANHEYYVTASYEGKIQGASQVNVDVKNPDNIKKLPKVAKPASDSYKKTLPKAGAKPSKNNQGDKDGSIVSVEFRDLKGNTITKTPKYGESINVYVITKNVIGKRYWLKLWESDYIGKNDLLYSKIHKIERDNQMIKIPLTKAMQQTGELGNDQNNPDYGEYTGERTDHQELFIEIAFADISMQSKTLNIDANIDFEIPEPTLSPAVVKDKKLEKTPVTCICKEQYKDLVWGKSVSCEFRKKVVQICAEIWGESRKMEMANELMTCMALETAQAFSANAGYPNATGLIQFTSGKYGAITAMNSTGYNNGKTITKDYLKNLSAVKQLDYVRLYFQMWIIEYKKTISDSLDMYMTIWCPSAVGRHDSFVCYSAERDKKNKNTFYEENKSAEYEYYDQTENNALSRLKKDYSKGNGEITKGELRPRLKYWKELGKNNKVENFSCEKKAVDKVISPTDKSKIVHFKKDISADRRKIVSQFTIDVLEKAAINSSNDKILINSTIRSTRRQAEAMFTNESNGKHIRYAAPGREVIKVYQDGVQAKNTKETIISNMDKKIVELSNKGKRVSLHCVSDEVYKKNNILDISYRSSEIKNPRDFIRELAKDSAVTMIIHPLNNVTSSPKIRYDTGEGAIHVEIKN